MAWSTSYINDILVKVNDKLVIKDLKEGHYYITQMNFLTRKVKVIHLVRAKNDDNALDTYRDYQSDHYHHPNDQALIKVIHNHGRVAIGVETLGGCGFEKLMERFDSLRNLKFSAIQDDDHFTIRVKKSQFRVVNNFTINDLLPGYWLMCRSHKKRVAFRFLSAKTANYAGILADSLDEYINAIYTDVPTRTMVVVSANADGSPKLDDLEKYFN